MPEHNLSAATLGRVAGQPVDLLRIADQIVWAAPDVSPPQTYTVFDGDSISVGSYDDTFVGSYEAMQFYRQVGVDLEVVDVGLYIPAGSSLIGLTGNVGVQMASTGYDSGTDYSSQPLRDSASPIGPLVEGWNWGELLEPALWPDETPYLLAGYSVGHHYLFGSDLTIDSIPSQPFPYFSLAQRAGGGMTRSWYTRESNLDFFSQSALTYGIDIRVRVVE